MSEKKIICQICNAETHVIKKHLDAAHASDGWNLDKYKVEFPDAPIISERVRKILDDAAAKKLEDEIKIGDKDVRIAFHEAFGLGTAPEAMTPSGKPINITLLGKHDFQDMVPDIDKNYVYNIGLMKIILMGMSENMPVYLWGHSGTGKTTAFEEVCGRTNRPMLRVQHTLNTEESNILGHTVLRGGETMFKPGPLPLAMKHGWTYLADEYDFGVPHVLSVYQPVLEGKPLVIKEAEGEWRVIRPHPNFRFVATGNTNGVGDESGLYQGTQLQNAANYERFAIVEKVQYMEPDIETLVLQSQANLHKKDADLLVKYGNKIRTSVDASEMSMPISPRALIHAGKIGTMRGDFVKGLELAYINRLSTIDREAARQLAQRLFA